MCMMSRKSEMVVNAETRLEEVRKLLKADDKTNLAVTAELQRQERDASANLVSVLIADKHAQAAKAEMAQTVAKAESASTNSWWWNRVVTVGASVKGLCLDAGEAVGYKKPEDAAAERRMRNEFLLKQEQEQEQLRLNAESLRKLATA